jgi:hypothetical protein
VHGLLDEEVGEIMALFDEWGETDRSHRKLAHRGSYLGRAWVSPSSVRRVLHLGDMHFRPLPKPGKSKRKPFPEWVEYKPNSIWIYDTERREALFDRTEVKDHRRRGIAVARQKLGAARSGETSVRAGSSPDNAGTTWYCQTGRVRLARREGVREEPAAERPSRRIHQLQPGGCGLGSDAHPS